MTYKIISIGKDSTTVEFILEGGRVVTGTVDVTGLYLSDGSVIPTTSVGDVEDVIDHLLYENMLVCDDFNCDETLFAANLEEVEDGQPGITNCLQVSKVSFNEEEFFVAVCDYAEFKNDENSTAVLFVKYTTDLEFIDAEVEIEDEE